MTKVEASQDEKQIVDTASYWFAVFRSGAQQPDQRLAFELWLSADPQHEAAYDHLQKTWDGCDHLSEDPDILDIRRRAWRRQPFSVARFGAIAAATALVLFFAGAVGLPYFGSISDPTSRSMVVERANEGMMASRQSRYYSTAIGERSNITLTDQSVVDLNTDTEIRTLFTENERRIILVRGQALFNVAHDPDRPFSVLASDQVITALGTEFEVRLDQGEVSVTLLEGRVTVDELDVITQQIGGALNSDHSRETRIELSPGERFAAGGVGPPVISTPDVEKVIDWKDGLLSFNRESLETIVYEMNRYSEQKIVIEGESLKQLSSGGTFKAGVPDGCISALKFNYPVESETDPETGEIILKWIENP